MPARRGEPNLLNDAGRKQGWQHRALSRVERKERVIYNFRATERFLPLVLRAASKRGMNRTAYMRRAVAAFIAHDLQIPYETVCDTFPAVDNNMRSERFVDGKGVNRRDDGEGYGSWEVR